jgi:hypothetical protein
VSISDIPRPINTSGAGWDAERASMDWPATVKRTTATRTTLDELPSVTVYDLLLHSYRLTQFKLAQNGVELLRQRTDGEILQDLLLAPGASMSEEVKSFFRSQNWVDMPSEIAKMLRKPTDVKKILDKGNGPYARQARRVDRISLTVGVVVMALAIGLMVTTPVERAVGACGCSMQTDSDSGSRRDDPATL